MSTDVTDIVKGIKNGKQEDFDRLLRKYSPLISKYVFSFSQSCAVSEDELRDEAQRALLSAAVSFDEEKGVGFGYYAKVCIRNALITVQRASRSREKKPKKEAAPAGGWRNISFEAFEGLKEEEIMEKIGTVLSVYEKKVFVMSLDGKSAGEIAAIVGKDEKSVNNAIFRSRSKIRKMADK